MQNVPFRAIVSDLDGTLLNANHMIGDFTIETLQKLASQGIDIILATGRNHTDLLPILKKIKINNAVMITSNGARAQDLQGNLLVRNYIPETIAFEIMNLPFDRTHICVNSYQGDDWFINTEVPQLRKYHQDSGFMYKVVNFAQHHGKTTEKVFFLGREPQDLVNIETSLKTTYGDKLSITYSTPVCLEIMNQNVSKATALEQVLAERNYGMQQCIAFGDGMNDIQMLTQVGKGCVMSNADPRLKSACPNLEIIGLNAQESVARYLCTLFNII
ncbi:Cof-type HAD-IIB family hydrolase [Histophilus somni]|uniref:Cof-type HAD-IIB family hydrolase n=1 Tax=Histophilus somni TaxID=731 RepID=UPI00003976C5|nr:Cof-type HAD-IIB family hydrolase [Histophilus somni]ACA30972.1 Cof-like hydrolase [Histophilus somni 2336]QEH17802.1 Cof-type HAD-IIB family hydrolase [Histophilus somni]QQF86857.1 Cof-type HAD-IIB family hydrolase [Histophilus somni]QQJ89345.1 Cof-type HAD-IIB family hydrolase [Histophilus somni]THA22117.1 Cof-type HAD-IIB family hydrolase [Histophilus somni]